ncbi:MAG: SPFH domain-containing protein [Campylobacterota bacterium]|nr:SPFH domain-containing protein [Campylobacterota bacterium]
MGLFDWAAGQLIDVIEWIDDSHDTMVYRFERHGNEIKYGAKLIVRESQVAVFVNEGEIADVMQPGTYELETKNIPILTSLQHWDHGFSSPFKAEVYFLSTKRFTDLKWGTKNPIMVRDPEFAMVRLRAFGTYEIRLNNPELFLKEVVGTDGHFTTDEIDAQLTNLIVSKFATVTGKSEVPVLDMAGNYEEFGKFVTQKISTYFDEYGLALTKMLIENISLPPEVEKALDKRTSRALTGNLDDNLKYNMGEAIGNSGENGNSMMGDMMGMGAGLAMGQQMANMFGNNQNNNAPSTGATPPPPPPPPQVKYFVAVNGQSTGPYDTATLQGMIQSGNVVRDTLVWCEGMSGWEKASDKVGNLFASVPPPL